MFAVLPCRAIVARRKASSLQLRNTGVAKQHTRGAHQTKYAAFTGGGALRIASAHQATTQTINTCHWVFARIAHAVHVAGPRGRTIRHAIGDVFAHARFAGAVVIAHAIVWAIETRWRQIHFTGITSAVVIAGNAATTIGHTVADFAG